MIIPVALGIAVLSLVVGYLVVIDLSPLLSPGLQFLQVVGVVAAVIGVASLTWLVRASSGSRPTRAARLVLGHGVAITGLALAGVIELYIREQLSPATGMGAIGLLGAFTFFLGFGLIGVVVAIGGAAARMHWGP